MDEPLSALPKPIFKLTTEQDVKIKPPKVYPFLNDLLPKKFINKYFNKKL